MELVKYTYDFAKGLCYEGCVFNNLCRLHAH